MKDRANLIWFLVALVMCLSVLAIAGAAGAAEPEPPKRHHNIFQDARLPPAIDTADALDSSEWFGTGLLGLVSGLAALWAVKAGREWRSGGPAMTGVLQLGLAPPADAGSRKWSGMA